MPCDDFCWGHAPQQHAFIYPPPFPAHYLILNENRYCLSALNTVLVTGDTGSAEMCFDGHDESCPKGSALRDLELPTVQQEVATSLLVAGAWLGSMLASKPSDALGRRCVIYRQQFVFIALYIVVRTTFFVFFCLLWWMIFRWARPICF